jgi:hypothetical protein
MARPAARAEADARVFRTVRDTLAAGARLDPATVAQARREQPLDAP